MNSHIPLFLLSNNTLWHQIATYPADQLNIYHPRSHAPPLLPPHVLHSHGACSGCSCHGDGKGLSVHRWHCYHGNPHRSRCLGGASRAGGVCSAPWTAPRRSRIPAQKLSHADCDRRDFHQPSPRHCQETDHTRWARRGGEGGQQPAVKFNYQKKYFLSSTVSSSYLLCILYVQIQPHRRDLGICNF